MLPHPKEFLLGTSFVLVRRREEDDIPPQGFHFIGSLKAPRHGGQLAIKSRALMQILDKLVIFNWATLMSPVAGPVFKMGVTVGVGRAPGTGQPLVPIRQDVVHIKGNVHGKDYPYTR